MRRVSASVDCWDCARYEPAGVLKKAGVFLTAVPSELALQTSRAFRLSMVGGLVVLAGSTVFLVQRTARVEATLTRQAEEVKGLSGLLNRAGPNPTRNASPRS